MPRFDKTGPEGRGPRTGRGRGNCSVVDVAGEVGERVSTVFGGGRRGRRARW